MVYLLDEIFLFICIIYYSKHVSADMEEMQFAKFPIEPEEREFIKYCQM